MSTINVPFCYCECQETSLFRRDLFFPCLPYASEKKIEKSYNYNFENSSEWTLLNPNAVFI